MPPMKSYIRYKILNVVNWYLIAFSIAILIGVWYPSNDRISLSKDYWECTQREDIPFDATTGRFGGKQTRHQNLCVKYELIERQ